MTSEAWARRAISGVELDYARCPEQLVLIQMNELRELFAPCEKLQTRAWWSEDMKALILEVGLVCE